MALQDTSKLLSHIAHAQSQDDAEYMLRHRTAVVVMSNHAAADDNRRLVLLRADKDIVLESVSFVPAAGVAAQADSHDLILAKNDGEGGMDSVFDTIDGTATAVTADQVNSFTIVENTDTLDEGEILVVEIDKNGNGSALGDITFIVEYRLD